MRSRDLRVNLLIGTGHCLSHFYSLCLPPLFLAWQREFHVSFAEVGLSVMMMSIMAGMLQTPYGFLVDRYGARPFLIGGTVLMSVAISAMAFATAFWQVAVLAMISGAGNATFHPADYAILSGSVSKEKLGRSFAFHTLTGNIGFILAPPVVAALLLVMDWRRVLLLLGLLGLPVVAAVVWQSGILKDQIRLEKKQRGLTPRELLFERTLVLFFLFYLLGAMAGSGVQAWIITVLHQVKGLDLAIASSALTAYMVGGASGVLVGGWVADTSTRSLAFFVAGLTTLSAVSTFAIGVLPLAGLGAMALLFVSGMALGASRTPRDIMLKDSAPPGQMGKVFGFVSSAQPLGGAITPVPFGFLIDHGRAELVFVLVPLLLLASLLCMGSAKASANRRAQATAAAE